MVLRHGAAKVQFPDDLTDGSIVIPGTEKGGPGRRTYHQHTYALVFDPHLDIGALGADDGEVSQFFHCIFLSCHHAALNSGVRTRFFHCAMNCSTSGVGLLLWSPCTCW